MYKHSKPFNFNPRSREGSDSGTQYAFDVLDISIHAPVKGATLTKKKNVLEWYHFNPRSREGSDLAVLQIKD